MKNSTKNSALTLLLFLLIISGYAQNSHPKNWHNPTQAGIPVVEGRLWQTGLDQFYDRLPAKAIGLVRTDVMNLARHNAGEYIRFTSNSSRITVRYEAKGFQSMLHMPATGVSGVDLYAVDQQNNWHWISGRYQFADTIQFDFSSIDASVKLKEFRLYLPLYNTVSWLEIGVDEGKSFQWIEASKEPPIVLYGTSILQGGCASRPGLAWSNILGRKISTPLVNLGFSGNGRMEKDLIDLIAEHPVKMVVLDCMPNLVDTRLYPATELLQRFQYAVEQIRKKSPAAPILLTEHCCGLPGTNLDKNTLNGYNTASLTVEEIYTKLKAAGVANLHLLKASAINFDTESTVDGTHPNDIGMMKYALAYEKIIRRILEGKKTR